MKCLCCGERFGNDTQKAIIHAGTVCGPQTGSDSDRERELPCPHDVFDYLGNRRQTPRVEPTS